jgi:mannose-1-phosphate guanylyltransferase
VTGSSSACAQAVVLVGGEGTRLRPLTSRVPKPVAPVVERPFVGYILDGLARHGVARAVFSAGYLAHAIEEVVGDGRDYGVAVDYVIEDQPLGTAGAIKNAERVLDDGCLLAFNGDVLTDVDLTELIAFHHAKGGLATIFLTPVDDPRRYGLVQLDGDGRVLEFIEKPGQEHTGAGLINAGIYVLEREVLDLIPPGEAFSIERGVFPRLASVGRLYGYVGDCYWRDIGTPESYLEAHFDLLERALVTTVADRMGDSYLFVAPSATVSPGARVVPPAYIGDDATLAAGARVGPLAVIGAGATVGERATVIESVLHGGVVIGDDAHVERSIVVRDAAIGARSRITQAIVGDGCRVGADNELANGCCLFPDTVLPDGSVKFREIDGGEGR